MTRARVALDARITRHLSVGMRAYVRELTCRLPRVAPEFDYAVFTDGRNFGFAEHVALPLHIARTRPALTHFLSHYAPLVARRPYIVTVHDLIHLLFPQYFKKTVGPYYRTVVRFVCARAAAVITDDERTSRDLQQFLGVPSERVRVIALGVDDEFLAPVQPYRAQRPYFIYAGNHREHKDLPALFAAWASLPAEHSIDIAITGDDDFGSQLQRYSRPDGRIVFLGELDQHTLAGRYAGAIALVHPALREGFGLPMVEAMAARCPVIACEQALPGVLDGAALTFPAGDSSAARDAMLRVISDEGLRARLVNEGRTRAQMLTWDRCARATADVYREVLNKQ